MKLTNKFKKNYNDMCRHKTRVSYNCIGEPVRDLVPLQATNSSNNSKIRKSTNNRKQSTIFVPDATSIRPCGQTQGDVFPSTSHIDTDPKKLNDVINSVRSFVFLRIRAGRDSIHSRNKKMLSLDKIIRTHHYQLHGMTSVAKRRIFNLMNTMRENENESSLLKIVCRILDISISSKLPQYLEEIFYELWSWFYDHDVVVMNPSNQRNGAKKELKKSLSVSHRNIMCCLQDIIQAKGGQFPPILLNDLAETLSIQTIKSSPTEDGVYILPSVNFMNGRNHSDGEIYSDVDDAIEAILNVFQKNDEIIENLDNRIFGFNALPLKRITAHHIKVQTQNLKDVENEELSWKDQTLDSLCKLRELCHIFLIQDSQRDGSVSTNQFCNIFWSWIRLKQMGDCQTMKNLKNAIYDFTYDAGNTFFYMDLIAHYHTQIIETSKIYLYLPSWYHSRKEERGIEMDIYRDLYCYMKRQKNSLIILKSTGLLQGSLSLHGKNTIKQNQAIDYTTLCSTKPIHSSTLTKKKGINIYLRSSRHEDNEMICQTMFFSKCFRFGDKMNHDKVQYDRHEKDKIHIRTRKSKPLLHFLNALLPSNLDPLYKCMDKKNESIRNECDNNLPLVENQGITNIYFRFPYVVPHTKKLIGSKIPMDGESSFSSPSYNPPTVAARRSVNNVGVDVNILNALFKQSELSLQFEKKKSKKKDTGIIEKQKRSLSESMISRSTRKVLKVKVEDSMTSVIDIKTQEMENYKEDSNKTEKQHHIKDDSFEEDSHFHELESDSETSSFDLKKKPIQHSKTQSVIKIQNFFRKQLDELEYKKSQKAVEKIEKERLVVFCRSSNATMIQKLVRGNIARKAFQAEKKAQKEREDMMYAKSIMTICKWVLHIQSEKKINLERIKSAVNIQCFIRQRQAKLLFWHYKSRQERHTSECDKIVYEVSKKSQIHEKSNNSYEASIKIICQKLITSIFIESSSYLPSIGFNLEDESSFECLNLVHIWLIDKWDWESFFDDVECSYLRISSKEFGRHGNLNYHRIRKKIQLCKQIIKLRRNFIVDYREERDEHVRRNTINVPLEKMIRDITTKDHLEKCNKNSGELQTKSAIYHKPSKECYVIPKMNKIEWKNQWKSINYTLKK